MRAISLWQPWASAVALGSKTIETRHWPTDYRGPLAIHAAKRRVRSELIHYGSYWNWQGALRGLGISFGGLQLEDVLPFGAIIATCILSDCRPTDSFTVGELDTLRLPTIGTSPELYGWTERQMGNFSPGRYGWVLTDIKPLAEPIPFVGHQGFFSVPDPLIQTA